MAAPVVVLSIIFINARVVEWTSTRDQLERLDRCRTLTAGAVGAQAPAWSGDPMGPAGSVRLRFNELQTIGSHNSTVVEPNALQRLVIAVLAPDRSAPLRYSHPPLWEQLEDGVRSLELDVRAHGDGQFLLSHSPVVANAGVAVDFPAALEEIALWSQSHPGHLPVTILVELKEDYAFLAPAQRDFGEVELIDLDRAFVDAFGDALLSPSELVDDTGSDGLRSAVLEHGWPTVESTRGTITVVLYPHERARAAYELRPVHQRSLFTSVSGANATALPPERTRDVLFVVEDVPDPSVITPLVQDGYFVRTRSDTDLMTDTEERDAALASGAQIVSTDYFGSHEQPTTGYRVSFADDALTRENPVLHPQ